MLNLLLKPVRIIRNIFRQIKVVFQWLPTIWEDRQWDQYYVYAILEKKLLLMEDFYNSDRCMPTEDSHTPEEIREILSILKRVKDENYTHVGLEDFYKTYPDYNWDITRHTEPIPDKPGWSQYTVKDTPEQQKLLKKCFARGDALKKKDLDDLFILLRKYIENWWD